MIPYLRYTINTLFISYVISNDDRTSLASMSGYLLYLQALCIGRHGQTFDIVYHMRTHYPSRTP